MRVLIFSLRCNAISSTVHNQDAFKVTEAEACLYKVRNALVCQTQAVLPVAKWAMPDDERYTETYVNNMHYPLRNRHNHLRLHTTQVTA